MNLIVTGGLGFIGSNFIKYMIKNRSEKINKIINIDKLGTGSSLDNLSDLEKNNNYLLLKKDLSKDIKDIYPLLKEGDIIINFAAETHVDRSISSPTSFIYNNIKSVINLLEFLRKDENKEKVLIHISTDEVYGDIINGYFTENDRLNPSSPYASSKAAGDLIIKSYVRTYGIKAIILRSTNNYGPFQFPEKLIPKTIISAIQNRNIPIYGNGKYVRDYIYVEDFCIAIEKIIENTNKINKGEIFNISSGEELEVITIVKKILDIMKKPYELIKYVEDRPGHDIRYGISSKKIRKTINWEPKYTFEKGIKKTIDWYIKNKWWWEKKVNEKILSHTPWKEKW